MDEADRKLLKDLSERLLRIAKKLRIYEDPNPSLPRWPLDDIASVSAEVAEALELAFKVWEIERNYSNLAQVTLNQVKVWVDQDCNHDCPLEAQALTHLYEAHKQAGSGLQKNAAALTTLAGFTRKPKEQWSIPMSKTEMARRLKDDPHARPRQIEEQLKEWGLEEVTPKKFRVRLDLMDDANRKRIQMPPRPW